RSVLTLAQHRRTGEEDAEYRDVVDDLVDGDEPALLHVRIEPGAGVERDDVVIRRVVASGPERLYFPVHDVADVFRPAAGLAHPGSIGNYLDGGLLIGAQVALEIVRYIDDEGVLTCIHRRIDRTELKASRWQEQGWQQRRGDAVGCVGAVLV